MCVFMYSLSSCHSYEEEKLLTETLFYNLMLFFIRFFLFFLPRHVQTVAVTPPDSPVLCSSMN